MWSPAHRVRVIGLDTGRGRVGRAVGAGVVHLVMAIITRRHRRPRAQVMFTFALIASHRTRARGTGMGLDIAMDRRCRAHQAREGTHPRPRPLIRRRRVDDLGGVVGSTPDHPLLSRSCPLPDHNTKRITPNTTADHDTPWSRPTPAVAVA